MIRTTIVLARLPPNMLHILKTGLNFRPRTFRVILMPSVASASLRGRFRFGIYNACFSICAIEAYSRSLIQNFEWLTISWWRPTWEWAFEGPLFTWAQFYLITPTLCTLTLIRPYQAHLQCSNFKALTSTPYHMASASSLMETGLNHHCLSAPSLLSFHVQLMIYFTLHTVWLSRYCSDKAWGSLIICSLHNFRNNSWVAYCICLLPPAFIFDRADFT
jgi:hypothetical protein